MKIFLDVGGHLGETLNEILKKKYYFDKIYCFEPSKKCFQSLRKFKDSRLKIFNFGLSNKNQNIKLYNPGLVNASIFTNNKNDRKNEYEIIKLVKTSEWFKKNLKYNDIIVVKLNCEGSECDIVDDLITSKELKKIYNILITFDIREFKNLKSRELEIRKKLKKTSLNNYCFSDNVMKGVTHKKRIQNWLEIIGVNTRIHKLEDLNKKYYNILKKYSNKSGLFNRFENNIKILLKYNDYPKSIKIVLQKLKRLLGLSRDLPYKK
tara:strand:- start:106 stop:897 length:792 start_codon:yes stop_codon:yes gene_type:complete